MSYDMNRLWCVFLQHGDVERISTPTMVGGNTSLYALSKISKGPMNLGLNLFLFLNRNTLLIGATFRKTRSTIVNLRFLVQEFA